MTIFIALFVGVVVGVIIGAAHVLRYDESPPVPLPLALARIRHQERIERRRWP